VRKAANHRAETFLRALSIQPVVPAVRRPDSALEAALAYCEIAERYSAGLDRPVLAGGLLKSPQDISAILEAGAIGASTSPQGLWNDA
jgi:hypothetical protein